jgi:alkylation response protein AidB-like acyl-CoA dehydrogenase
MVAEPRPDIYEEEHRMFRDSFRKFVEAEIVPHHAQWEKDGMVSREVWRKAGAQGFLCPQVPEEFGGLGLRDFRYNAIVGEEITRGMASGVGFTLQNDITADYIIHYGTEEQKKKYLPKMVSGELITSIAMSEPGTGSDLQGIRTTAKPMGDSYILNGQKTFITNGILSDLCIVVARTSDAKSHTGISLLLVERAWEGFSKGKKLDKVGMHAQDTAELFFQDVKVPRENLLGGQEGMGFIHLMQQLPQERLSIAVAAVAACEQALEGTIQYCKERHAFGKPIGTFQNSRFKLAEMKTETVIARVFLNDCILLLNAGQLTVERAAMAKWWTTELQKKLIDQCLQLHGGYGYMMEYPIAKAFIDSRAQTIYGGSTEIMKEIIGRAMGF